MRHSSQSTVKIGITGPPGAGKSTLVYCLASLFLNEGSKVGIIAVDPSSPFTGGALLGDRVRMGELSGNGQVYFRSMASRGATGGLSSATDNVSMVLDAFEQLGVELTAAAATGLFVAIAMDTGWFRFERTSAATFRAGARRCVAVAGPTAACGRGRPGWSW